MNEIFNAKFLIGNACNIIALISFIFIIIQSIFQYFISFRYSTFYHIPYKYFNKINKRIFFESFSLLGLSLLLLGIAIFFINDISFGDNIINLDTILNFFIAILILSFPNFLVKFIKKKEFSDYINYKNIVVVLTLILIINTIFYVLIIIILNNLFSLFIGNHYDIKTINNVIISLIYIPKYIKNIFFISTGSSNPAYKKEYETFFYKGVFYSVVYDYGDKVLAIESCLEFDNNKTIVFKIGSYFIISKAGLVIDYNFYDVVKRELKNKEQINIIDEPICTSLKNIYIIIGKDFLKMIQEKTKISNYSKNKK